MRRSTKAGDILSGENILQSPQGETLVLPVGMRAFCMNQSLGRRKEKWRPLHVEVSPSAGLDVEIVCAIDERRRKKIVGAAFLEIAQGSPNVAEGEMDEAISAQNDVDLRQVIAENVAVNEPAPCPAEFLDIVRYQLADDVDADILLTRRLQLFHPIEISASGIEQ